MTLKSVSSETSLALAKLFSKKETDEVRAQVGPGVHPIDVTVRVSGSIKVAEDGHRASTIKVLTKATLALLIKRMGITRLSALDTLASVFKESMEMDEDARERLLEESGVEEAMELFKESVVDVLPKIPTKGRVTTQLEVEVFSPEINLDSSLLSEEAESNTG